MFEKPIQHTNNTNLLESSDYDYDTLNESNLTVYPEFYEPYSGPAFIDIDGWPL